MDCNNYWLLQEEDNDNLRYAIDNFPALIFNVESISRLHGFARTIIIREDLTGKTLNFIPKKKGFQFILDGKDLFYFEGLKQKGFDVRYDFDDTSRLVTVDYEKKEYLEIFFDGIIQVESTDKERAPGIPYYKIKRS
jgi:hypothetical protein